MAEKNARTRPDTARRVLAHVGRYLATLVALNAVALLPGTDPRVAIALGALSVVLYPVARLAAATVTTVRDWRAGRPLEVPTPARGLLALVLAAGVASDGGPADALLRGATAERGLRAGRTFAPSRRAALGARLAVLLAALIICLEVFSVLLLAGTPHFDAACWATLLTVVACGVAVPLAYLAHVLLGVARERRTKGAAAGWSLDERTERAVEHGGAIVFPRNDERRRRYVAFARNVCLGCVAAGIVTLAAVALVPEESRFALFEALPLVHGVVVAVIAVGVFCWPVAAGWWAHRSGTSLTQTIVLEDGHLSYALTTGSGGLAETSSWDLDGVAGYEVGRWCVKVRGHGSTPHGEKDFRLSIPRTFDGEKRFLRELDERVARNRSTAAARRSS